jgi:hypothetical protein
MKVETDTLAHIDPLSVIPVPTWLLVLNDDWHDEELAVYELPDSRPHQEL